MSLLLLFANGPGIPAANQTDVMEAVATHWSGDDSLPPLWLDRCDASQRLPFGTMTHIDGSYEILSGDDATQWDHERHQVQLAVWASSESQSIALALAARKRFRRAALPMGGREISCVVGRRLGPFEDPDRQAGEDLAFGCFLTLTIECRSIL